jgi:hypothetical protein
MKDDKKEDSLEEKKVEIKKTTSVEISATTKPVEEPPKAAKSILDPEESDLKEALPQDKENISLKKEGGKKEETKKSSKTNNFVIVGIVAGMVILVAGATVLLLSLRSRSQEEAILEESLIEATPTPAPGITLERKNITFEVLNASSTSGLAKKGAEKLEALGYKIGKTGNYSGEVEENELYLSKDLMEKKDLILEDLKADFKISTVSGELKSATSSGRLILIK